MENLMGSKIVRKSNESGLSKRKRDLGRETTEPEKVKIEGDSEPSLSVSHSQSEKPQPESSGAAPEKDTFPPNLFVSGEEGEEKSRSRPSLSHGLISVLGRRRMMEDAVMVAPQLEVGEMEGYDFFAVYGGAGVANACRERMHQLLLKELEAFFGNEGVGGKVNWEAVMAAAFQKMDEEVRSWFGGMEEVDGIISVKNVEPTALVVLVGKEEIVVANCGDSKAVLCRNGVALPLSNEHKLEKPEQRTRIEAADGETVESSRVRVLGVPATSRSIGDTFLKSYVISVPEVTINERTELDEFLIIASDGLWDVISNEDTCQIAKQWLDGRIRRGNSRLEPTVGGIFSEAGETLPGEAAAVLAEFALAKGSKDNISVIIVQLKQ